jgi:hypothetical protein
MEKCIDVAIVLETLVDWSWDKTEIHLSRWLVREGDLPVCL